MATKERLAREAGTRLIATQALCGTVWRTPEELASIVVLFASSDGWMDRVRLRAEGRWYERLYHGPTTIFGSLAGYRGNPPGSTTTVSPRELSSWPPEFLRSTPSW